MPDPQVLHDDYGDAITVEADGIAAGPLPGDEWTTPAEGDRPGTSTLGQQQMTASRLAAKGVASQEDKLAFCSFVAQRPISSSKDLSFTEAVEVLRQASEIPAGAS